MDTFELLPSLAQGELAESSAPELVAAIFRSRASGTLSIETPDAEIRVFFRGGEMCGTGAFAGFRTLAVVLLSNDWVNALDIDSSRLEAVATGKRHGEVLIAKGILTPEQLKHALGTQHRQNLGSLLSRAVGRYELRGFEPPPPWARDVLVDPVGCIVDALESEQHKARRQKIIDWLGNFPARLSVDWPELSGRVVLPPKDRRAAALLALPRKLSEFVAASRLGQERAEALLVTLLLAGAVEAHPVVQTESGSTPILAPVRSSPPPLPPESVSVEMAPELLPELPEMAEMPPEQQPQAEVQLEPAQPEPQSEAHAEPLLDAQAELLLESEPELAFEALPEGAMSGALVEPAPEELLPGGRLPREPILDPAQLEAEPLAEALATGPQPPPHSRRNAPPSRRPPGEREAELHLDSLQLAADPQGGQGAAGLDPDAPLELDRSAAVAARGEARSRTAPDAMLRQDLTFDGSPDDPLPGLDANASRRPAIAADTSEQDGRDLRKKLMMQGMRNLRSAPPPAGAGVPEHTPPPAPPPPVDESRLGPEELLFVDEVRSRVKLAATQTAYTRLGVTPASTSEQIKAAYIAAAKRFHPDRSSAEGLAGLGPELQTLFSVLKEAYDLVATPDARSRYDKALKLGVGSSRHDDAVLMLKMGEVLLKKRDFDGATLKLRRAVDLEPTGDNIAALAWGLVCDPKQSAAGKEEAASLINRALRAPGITARTYYVAGVLWRTKDPESAADAFRKVLELEPGHSDASLELRLLQSRRKGKSIGGGVLSGLLFGKRKQ